MISSSLLQQRSQCVALSTTSHTYTTKGSSRRTGTSTFGPKKEERKTEEKKGLGGGAIFGIVLLLVLVIGIAAWCVYAYRHPTSKSGLFFIEVKFSSVTLVTKNSLLRPPGRGGGVVIPYTYIHTLFGVLYIVHRQYSQNMGYIGMCSPKGYGFSDVLVIKVVVFAPVLKWVYFFMKLLFHQYLKDHEQKSFKMPWSELGD